MHLAAEVIARLQHLGQTVATCESLTGGAVGAALSSVPGASAVLRGGLITYATELKISLAEVAADLIDRVGVIDEAVVLQMALGARKRCGSHWGIATTGVAGPASTGQAAVGTVWIAVVGPPTEQGMLSHAQEFHFSGDRAAIRQASTDAALAMLLKLVR